MKQPKHNKFYTFHQSLPLSNMKDVLYSLLGNVAGNTTENLMNPVDKVDQVIHDAIETHGDDGRGGGMSVVNFLQVYLPYFAKKEDLVSLERVRLSAEKIQRAIAMFN